MRTRTVISCMALAAAALAAATAPSALAAPATVGTHTPSVGQNVGGGLLTRQPLAVGQAIYVIGTAPREYRVTAEHRNGEAYYVTVSPRLVPGTCARVLFTS